MSGGRTVAGVAEVAVVAVGDERRDHLALGARQRVRAAQQYLGELAHRLRRLGAEREAAGDARQAVRQSNVWQFRLVNEARILGTALVSLNSAKPLGSC